ncbi:apolipoprotein N-acyltransferase [Gangjinia marincola]|uniref:Apolipoprotein N-acyltransferase n=1 Tax=Gangjinia marincola TaxID=578463 RepID=A0ABP3XPR2_9FLAO
MKNWLLAVVSGILLALGWPTYGFPGLLFIAFVPLLWAEYNYRTKVSKPRKSVVLALGYTSFFTWNLIATYWLYFSTVFGMVFAVLVNSLLMALVFVLYHVVAKRSNFRTSTIFLVSLWLVFERLHLEWEFAWPWLNLGNAFSEYTGWIQWYEYTGASGGALWVWIINVVIFYEVLAFQKGTKRNYFPAILKAGLLILIPIGVSQFVLQRYLHGEDTIDVVVLQPNINPYTEKYTTTNKRIGDLLFSLAAEEIDQGTDLLVAPETVYAEGFGIDLDRFEFSAEKRRAKNFLSAHPKLNYIAGVQFYRKHSTEKTILPTSNYVRENLWVDTYNSAFLLNNQRIETPVYHKSKLVVGVENLPYQSVLKPILGDVMLDLGGTVMMKTTQEDREIFSLTNGVAVAPIICYESVFGDYLAGYVRNGAQVLAIITNDAWWGNTQGHKQHLSYARLRAIETRRSVVRSANTGISALIDETGKITTSLGYEQQGTLKGKVTYNDKETLYVTLGDYIPRIARFLALFLFLFTMIKQKHTMKRK